MTVARYFQNANSYKNVQEPKFDAYGIYLKNIIDLENSQICFSR